MAGDFPTDVRYTETDEWVRREDGEIVSGITAYAAEQLGDVVYLQLPAVGARVARGDAFGEIESVKAVSDLYAPLSGEVIAANDQLDANPGLINEDPYGRGWIVRMRPDSMDELDSLLDAERYEQSTTERH